MSPSAYGSASPSPVDSTSNPQNHHSCRWDPGCSQEPGVLRCLYSSAPSRVVHAQIDRESMNTKHPFRLRQCLKLTAILVVIATVSAASSAAVRGAVRDT